jgi:hypothetical protein
MSSNDPNFRWQGPRTDYQRNANGIDHTEAGRRLRNHRAGRNPNDDGPVVVEKALTPEAEILLLKEHVRQLTARLAKLENK